MKAKIPSDIFEKYRIDPEWFVRKSKIHGIMHEYRVLVFAYLIGVGENANVDFLCEAAIAHDTQRHADGLDLEHGKRAAEWLKQKNRPEEICRIVEWHVPDDKLAPSMTLDLKCFKDADALDRWRIHDLNVSFLRTDTAKGLVEFSKQLYGLTAKVQCNYEAEMISALQALNALE